MMKPKTLESMSFDRDRLFGKGLLFFLYFTVPSVSGVVDKNEEACAWGIGKMRGYDKQRFG